MRSYLVAASVVFLFAAAASALPGDVAWLVQGETAEAHRVAVGDTAEIRFGAGSDDSKLIGVSGSADLCFLPDVGGAGGAARITVYRAVAYPPDDDARITLPAITFDGTDCTPLVMGRYWFEIDTPADGIEIAIVTITGR